MAAILSRPQCVKYDYMAELRAVYARPCTRQLGMGIANCKVNTNETQGSHTYMLQPTNGTVTTLR